MSERWTELLQLQAQCSPDKLSQGVRRQHREVSRASISPLGTKGGSKTRAGGRNCCLLLVSAALLESSVNLHTSQFYVYTLQWAGRCSFPFLVCSSFVSFPLSTGLRVTSLRRRGAISSMFSSKSSAPCFQATLAKWTKLLCWKKSLAFCRSTMVRFSAALHALARQLL